jgi:hypothetical protein
MSELWLPDSAGELLAVTIVPNQSSDSEWNGMMLINHSGIDWLAGQLDTGTYFDILESIGINPVTFVESTEQYINGLVDQLLAE